MFNVNTAENVDTSKKTMPLIRTKYDFDNLLSKAFTVGRWEAKKYFEELVDYCLLNDNSTDAMRVITLIPTDSSADNFAGGICCHKLFEYYLLHEHISEALDMLDSTKMRINEEKCLSLLFEHYLAHDDISNACNVFLITLANYKPHTCIAEFKALLLKYSAHNRVSEILEAYEICLDPERDWFDATSGKDGTYDDGKLRIKSFIYDDKYREIESREEKFTLSVDNSTHQLSRKGITKKIQPSELFLLFKLHEAVDNTSSQDAIDQENKIIKENPLCEIFSLLQKFNRDGNTHSQVIIDLNILDAGAIEINFNTRLADKDFTPVGFGVGQALKRGFGRILKQTLVIKTSINVQGENNVVNSSQTVINTGGLGLGIFGAATVASGAYVYDRHLERQAKIAVPVTDSSLTSSHK